MGNRIAVGYLQTELSFAKTKCQESPPWQFQMIRILEAAAGQISKWKKNVLSHLICVSPSFHLFAPVPSSVRATLTLECCVTNDLE